MSTCYLTPLVVLRTVEGIDPFLSDLETNSTLSRRRLTLTIGKTAYWLIRVAAMTFLLCGEVTMQTSDEVREFGDEMIDAEDTGLFQQVFIELDVRKVVRLLRQKQCYPPQSYLGSYVIQEVIM